MVPCKNFSESRVGALGDENAQRVACVTGEAVSELASQWLPMQADVVRGHDVEFLSVSI